MAGEPPIYTKCQDCPRMIRQDPHRTGPRRKYCVPCAQERRRANLRDAQRRHRGRQRAMSTDASPPERPADEPSIGSSISQMLESGWGDRRICEELALLKASVQANGYTMAIVTIYDPDKDIYEIVDGFHRWT